MINFKLLKELRISPCLGTIQPRVYFNLSARKIPEVLFFQEFRDDCGG